MVKDDFVDQGEGERKPEVLLFRMLGEKIKEGIGEFDEGREKG